MAVEAFKMADTGTIEQSDKFISFKPKKGATGRFAILAKQVAIVHCFYVPELYGNVYSNEGEYLKKNYKEQIKYIYPVVSYPTDSNGEFLYEKGGETPKGNIEVMPIVFSQKEYSNMLEKNNIIKKQTGGKGSIMDVDLLCIAGEEKQIEGSGVKFIEKTYELSGDPKTYPSSPMWIEQIKEGLKNYYDTIQATFAKTFETDAELIASIESAKQRNASGGSRNNGTRSLPAGDAEQKALPVGVEKAEVPATPNDNDLPVGEDFDPDSLFKRK